MRTVLETQQVRRTRRENFRFWICRQIFQNRVARPVVEYPIGPHLRFPAQAPLSYYRQALSAMNKKCDWKFKEMVERDMKALEKKENL